MNDIEIKYKSLFKKFANYTCENQITIDEYLKSLDSKDTDKAYNSG